MNKQAESITRKVLTPKYLAAAHDDPVQPIRTNYQNELNIFDLFVFAFNLLASKFFKKNENHILVGHIDTNGVFDDCKQPQKIKAVNSTLN